MKLSLPIGNRELYLAAKWNNKQKMCYGMTNRAVVNQQCVGYVPFCDYDDSSKEEVLELWGRLIVGHGLGDTYFFKTRADGRHWQVICPSIMKLGEYCELLFESGCDRTFMGMGLMMGSWTLRIFEKDDRKEFPEPVFDAFIMAESKRPYSEAHYQFCQGYYNCPKRYIGVPIKTDLELHRFMTGNFERRKFV